MGTGKLDKKGRQKRREDLIRYIRESGPVTSSQICRKFGTSRSSLSDDLRAINVSGDIILSPSKGLYVYNEKYAGESLPHCKIDRESVRQWVILLALSRHDMTQAEIMDFLRASEISCTATSLYKDLSFLQEHGLISRFSKGRSRFYRSECLHETDGSEIRRFFRSQQTRSKRVHIEDIQALNLKIRHSTDPSLYEGSGGNGESVITSGKRSLLSGEQLKMLESFEQFPFAEKALKIQYRTNAGGIADCIFQTGLIVYNVETSRIYLIGKSLKMQYCIIPLDQILSVSVSRRNNVCFNATQFHVMFREMFQVSADDPVEVRVRFENRTYIRDKIERLCRIRQSGRMQIAGGEILYTDRIRGEGDFARYLRKFGRSAIVEAPESLRLRMIDSSRKIIARYEDIPEERSTSENGSSNADL